jgi:hypothetical protein
MSIYFFVTALRKEKAERERKQKEEAMMLATYDDGIDDMAMGYILGQNNNDVQEIQ